MPLKEAPKELLSIQFRFRDFYMLSFDSNLLPFETVERESLNFKTTPTFGVNFEGKTVGIDLDIRITREGEEKLLASCKTRTEFDVNNMPITKDGNNVEVGFLAPIVHSFVSLAVSTTRGALSIISGGKYLLPIIDVKDFGLTTPREKDGTYIRVEEVQLPNPSSPSEILPPS